MGFISFKPGSHVRHLGNLCQIVKTHSATEVVVKNLSTKAQDIVCVADLKSPDADEILPVDPIEILANKDRSEAERRRKIIDPILMAVKGRTALVKKVANENGVSVSTLRRWVKKFKDRRLLSDLAPKRRGRTMPDQLKIKQEKYIEKVIDEYYLTRQKLAVTAVYRHLQKLCRDARIDIPHISTLRRRISRLPNRLKTKKRHGEKAAHELYDPIKGKFPGADFPLSHVQIDHTKLDIELVDNKDRLPIGRPWLTVAIDVFSRMITGFYLSLDHPSALSVGQCVVHSICDKDIDLARFNIEGDWPVWGVMQVLHADNGTDFRSETISNSCAEYGINIEWRPVGKPEFGGHVERIFKTLNAEIHTLPGTTFSNIREKGANNPRKSAQLTFDELEQILYSFIVQEYHNRKHSSLGISPRQKWNQGINGNGRGSKGVGIFDKITNTKRLCRDFFPSTERVVSREGITWDGICYTSDELIPWINEKKGRQNHRFRVRRDPRDISKIYFLDPKRKDYVVVPWRKTEQSPMSLWEMRAAKKHAAVHATGLSGEEAVFAGREARERIKENAKKETCRIRRETAKKKVHKSAIAKAPISTSSEVKVLPKQPTKMGAANLRLVKDTYSKIEQPLPDEEDEEYSFTDDELKPRWRDV